MVERLLHFVCASVARGKEADWKKELSGTFFPSSYYPPSIRCEARSVSVVIAIDEIPAFLQQGGNYLDLRSPAIKCQQLLPLPAIVLLTAAFGTAKTLCGDRLHS
jgi:hypothetical protein